MGNCFPAGIDIGSTTVKLVIFITAPFNILKGAVLSAVTYLLYKRVSPLLHQKSAR